jgi:trigger factor
MSQAPLLNSKLDFQQTLEPRCILKLDVKTPQEFSLKARQEAIKEVNKAKVIDGFRKGKAPLELVEKNFPEHIHQVWKEKLANLAIQECLKSAPRPLTTQTRILYDVTHISLIEPSTLTLRYEVEPTVPELDLTDFKSSTIEKPLVNEEKIEETIRQTQYFFASWETISDRAAQRGDCVLLNVDVINEGKKEPLFKQTRFEVNSKQMAQWMIEAVVGMQTGEQKAARSVPDQDASQEEQALFQPKDVMLTLVSIEKAQLPPLDDEFAQKVGASSVDDLRQKVTHILNNQSNNHVLTKQREALTQFILNKYPFELPDTQVEREVKFRLKQLFDDPHFGPYWQSLNETERRNSILALEEQSKKAIRMFYLSQKILKDKNLKITSEDLQKAPIEPLEVLLNPHMGAHNPHAVDINHAESYSKLVLEKAQDALLADIGNLG